MAWFGARRPLFDVPDGDPLVRALHQALSEVEPDPTYRQRLRGEILNRHVAMREGQISRPPSRSMTRIGRAVLLASLTLASSVTAAGAASQASIPGEMLYPVKRQLEAIRLGLASGAARDELLETALGERLDEVARLASAGEWQLVALASVDVSSAQEAVAARGRPLDAGSQAEVDARIARLQALLATAPEGARDGLWHALQNAVRHAAKPIVPPADAGKGAPPAQDPEQQRPNPGGANSGAAPGSPGNGAGSPKPTAQPQASHTPGEASAEDGQPSAPPDRGSDPPDPQNE